MADLEFKIQRLKMVNDQIRRRGLTDKRLLKAMGKVPRELFVQPDDFAWAYADGALPISHGQTISQPYIVALMTHLLHLEENSRVLEIGTGSGYQAAILAELSAEVHTVELIPGLATRAEEILQKLGYRNVCVHQGDGTLGWLADAPYDGIIVTAGGPKVPPPLVEQLAEGGRLVIPVGGHGVQVLEVYQKLGGKTQSEQNISVVFVPLRGVHGWK